MNNSFGQSLTKSPVKLQVWVSCLFFFALILSLLLIQGHYGKQESVKGVIRDESFYRITAEKHGNISEVYVKEGQKVNKGDVLFRVVISAQEIEDHDSGKLMNVENIIRLKSMLEKYSKEEEFQKIELDVIVLEKKKFFEQIEIDLNKVKSIEDGYLKKLTILRAQLKDFKKLQAEKSINKTEVENLKQTIIDNEIAVKKAEIEKQNIIKTKSEKEIYFARSQREGLQIQHEIYRSKSEVINEMNKTVMQKEYVVASPVNGFVHYSDILKGDYVDGKYPVMILKGNVVSKPQIVLLLSTKQIGLLDEKQKVFVRVDTFPYETYGMLSAEVVSISKTPTKIGIDDKESWFRIRLNIKEDDDYTQIPLEYLIDGMTVTTALRQPEQNLLEWLFLPVKKAFKRNPDFIGNDI